MKIYDFRGAPNPKKLRVYLAEKGIEVPFEDVDIPSGGTRKPEFLAKNALGGLPVLELHDGSCYPESLPIIEYFEELHPDPPMIGTTPEERLRVRGLERICDSGVLIRLGAVIAHSHPFFARVGKQIPEMVERSRKFMNNSLRYLNDQIGDSPFIAGDKVSIADCTLCAALYFGHVMNTPVDLGEFSNLARWHEAFKQRPSAKA